MSRIAEGFPKLAQYIGDSTESYFPRYFNDYMMSRQKISTGELVILIKDYYVEYSKQTLMYFVPIRLLEQNIVPFSSITNWTSSYRKFPKYLATRFSIIDKNWIETKIVR